MLEKIKALMEKYREVIIYLVFGVLTTAVNYVIYLPCYNLLGLSSSSPCTPHQGAKAICLQNQSCPSHACSPP